MGFSWFIIIGAIAGWLAGQLMRGHGFGLFGDIGIGVLGAVIGGFVFNLLGLESFGIIGAIVTATIGAVILLWLLRLSGGKAAP